MVMFEQSRRLREPLRWGRRERVAIAALVSCVVLAAVALGVYLASTGSSARADCVTVTFGSTMGGGQLHACGSQARQICADPARYRGIAERFRKEAAQWYPKEQADKIKFAEAFELCEYGRKPSKEELAKLFPFVEPQK